MIKNGLKLLVVTALILTLGACNSLKRTIYLQDATDEALVTMSNSGLIRIKPFDRLTVVVTSKNPELAAPFNAATSYSSLSSNPMGVSSTTGASSLQIRTVDANGNLFIPIIGNVNCVGKTRAELANEIAGKIISGGYISDAIVNIQFADMKISVLGEVTRPGQFDITRDRLTLFEALAMAGDMTIYGNRSNVAVVRKVEGKEECIVHRVNLLSADAISSPAFHLQQGDVVYVLPNKYKAATAEINQNRSFWISLASIALTATSIVLSAISLKR